MTKVDNENRLARSYQWLERSGGARRNDLDLKDGMRDPCRNCSLSLLQQQPINLNEIKLNRTK